MEKNISHTELFKRYLNNACTPQEIELLMGQFGTLTEKDLRKSISDTLRKGNEPASLSPESKQHLASLYKNISAKLKTDEDKIIELPFYKRKAFVYLSAACIALVVTGIAAMLHNNYPNVKFKDLAAELVSHDIPPGGNKAVLTLADGKTITLNEAADGELVKVEGMVIRKTGQGQLVYEVVGNDASAAAGSYNTISTPKGGTYQIILPDGTKVWLNAASKLKFPTSFVSLNERKVELSGEAYFEVTKDASQPFRVLTVKQEVQVLGTHFNISSYAEESAVKTTLFEGSVKVKNLQGVKEGHIILKPGQQSIINEGVIKVTKADVDEVLAWKNGVFVFNDEPLESIMKKVSRWYDVEVIYEGVDKNKLFGGSVSRFDNVSKVLRQLELTGGVHFKIEEGRIIAMK
ncbi:FecR family protein [Pedobacter nyackensis]|uniref:FecR family protein n=1 Tax=Pedobacter nyackensis TaxID=475255 RepID=UPI00292F7DD5|nr:FecR domain-containing protein [Pedobacter nyackensis]